VTLTITSQNNGKLKNGAIEIPVAYMCAIHATPTGMGGSAHPCTTSQTLTKDASPISTRWLRIGGTINASNTNVDPGVYTDVLTVTLTVP